MAEEEKILQALRNNARMMQDNAYYMNRRASIIETIQDAMEDLHRLDERRANAKQIEKECAEGLAKLRKQFKKKVQAPKIEKYKAMIERLAILQAQLDKMEE